METSKPLVDATQRISLGDEEKVKDLLAGTVFSLWEAVNNLTRLRPSKRTSYRVSIFGSARMGPGTPVYQEVKRLASALTILGCDIITGGGPGLMQAANEGAIAGDAAGKHDSVGIRINLPFEQKVNEFVERNYNHQTFFTRLHHFTLASDAFVVVPGGIGTALETLMVWQLLQVGHLEPMPLVLIGSMYAELVEWVKRNMLREPGRLVNPEDVEIPRCVSTVDEAVEIIGQHRTAVFDRGAAA